MQICSIVFTVIEIQMRYTVKHNNLLVQLAQWSCFCGPKHHIFSSHRLCWRRMEKINWTDHVRNEEVLLRVKEQRNILHELSKQNVNWIGHILCRNCLLQWVIEGKIKGGIEVTGRRERRCRKLLHDLKERRGYSHLKEEALDCTMWRACFGRGFGPVIRQTTKWMRLCLSVVSEPSTKETQ
jgi:hypothetical protein